MEMEKRGLANIIITVLVVLIALVAIVIVWLLISPLFGEDVAVGEFEVNLEIIPGSIKFSEDNETMNLTVRRNAGNNVDFIGFLIAIWDEDGNNCVRTIDVVLEEFETWSGTISLVDDGCSLGVVKEIEVIPLIREEDGDVIQGRISDEHTIPDEDRVNPPDSSTPPATTQCGNDVKEIGEACDGTDLDLETCESRGFDGGTLGCSPDCFSFDYSQCTMNTPPTVGLVSYWDFDEIISSAEMYEFNTAFTAQDEIYDNFVVGQTFTVGATGPDEDFDVGSVNLRLRAVGNPGTLQVSITDAVYQGLPEGPVLASGTAEDTEIGDSGWYRIYLDTPYTLQAGESYAVILEAPAGTASDMYTWYYDIGDPYGGGSRVENFSGPWIKISGDMTFEIYSEGSDPHVTDVGGVNYNNATIVGDISLVTDDCAVGNCLSFEGDDDWLSIPFDNSLDVLDNEGPFTFMAWIKLSALDDVSVLYAQENSGGLGRMWLNIFDTGELSSPLVNSTDRLSSTYFGDHLDEWHHVAMTFDGISATGYIDGVASGTVMKEDALDEDCFGDYRIGITKTDAKEFTGAMDEVALYNIALTEEEINDYYLLATGAAQYSPLRFIQMADTHIITNGECDTDDPTGEDLWYGGMPEDGRTSCPGPILHYVEGCEDTEPHDPMDDWNGHGFPDNWDTCPWFNRSINVTSQLNWIAVSLAPTIAANAVVDLAKDYDPEFVFISGDLIAVSNNAAATADCTSPDGGNHNDSYNLFNDIMSKLDAPYFPVGARAHDHVTDTWECTNLYLDSFDDKWGGDPNAPYHLDDVGGNALDWYFVQDDNLFVGLSEVENDGIDSNFFNDTFLEEVLEQYKNKNMKLFIQIHNPWQCFDQHLYDLYGVSDTRCVAARRIQTLYDNYVNGEFRVIVILAGHTHANQWDDNDEYMPSVNGMIYHTVVTATMNYPSDFRVIEVTKNTISMMQSASASPGVDALSLEILENHDGSGIWPNETGYGDDWERDIFIDLR